MAIYPLRSYDRAAALTYAHRWAFGRNPAYYNFDAIGGDCTNYASQCLYAGAGVMNYTPTFGWYYISVDQRAPAWTGVPYFYNFLLREQPSVGPVGTEVDRQESVAGDFVQLSFDGISFAHTPIIVEVIGGHAQSDDDILVAAHSYDADYKPLSRYEYAKVRFLHIVGIRTP